MTRLLTDGAETGSISKWVVSASWGVSSSVKRTGAYSYHKTGSAGSASCYRILGATPSEYYIRVAIYVNVAGADMTHTISTYSGGTQGFRFGINSLGANITQFSVYDGATLRASSVNTLTMLTSEWHVFEFHVKHAANPNGVIEVKFDGISIISYTGTVNATATIDRLYLFGFNSAVQVACDDIALNDTNGVVDNSWVGDGGVLSVLVPIATGTYVGFLASGSASTWQSTDEVPANSTDFAYTSVSGTVTTFVMSKISGLPAGASISRIWVELYAKESAAVGDKIATFLKSGSVNSTGTSQNLTTAFSGYASAEYLTDPNVTGSWTVTAVNNIEAGMVAE